MRASKDCTSVTEGLKKSNRRIGKIALVVEIDKNAKTLCFFVTKILKKYILIKSSRIGLFLRLLNTKFAFISIPNDLAHFRTELPEVAGALLPMVLRTLRNSSAEDFSGIYSY